MASLFDVITVAVVTLKLLVLFMILYHFVTETKKEEVAVAYASQMRR